MIASISSIVQQSLPQGGWAILALVLIISLGYVAALIWSVAGQVESKPAQKPLSLSVDPQKRTVAPVTSSRPVKRVVQPAVSTLPVTAPPPALTPAPVAVLPAVEATPVVEAAPAPVLVMEVVPEVEAETVPLAVVEPPVIVVEEQPILIAEVIEEPAILIVETIADDLQRIEGIGPKIASVLANAGITTFEQLARMDVAQIRAVLMGRVRIFNPESWPAQAQLAVEGKWDELAIMQSGLKAGRRA